MSKFNLTEWALRHRAITLFLLLTVAIAGVFSLSKLGQLEDPNFSVPSMTAVVVWPGATAQQVQDEVLNRMEKKFEQIDNFEKVVTYARQGYGGMTLTVKGGTSKADQREAWYQARKKLDDLRLELPEGIVGPIVNDEYGDVYGLMYAVKGDGIGHAELSDAAEDIKRRMLKVPMVKKVDLIGKQAKRVYVEFSHERLASLGVTPLAIAESLKSQNAMLPAGQIDTQGDRVLVRVSGQFASLDDIRQVPVVAGGRTIRLGDIATVTRGFEDPPFYTVRHNGQPVLMLGISMTSDGNIVELGDQMASAVARLQSELPHGVELERVADQPTTVKDAIWDFERSLIEALVIVIAVSLVSLGWRAGLVVAMSVPLVLSARGRVDAGHGVEPRADLAGLADHRARAAGGRLDHCDRDDGGEDGVRLGPHQGGRLLLRGHRDAAPDGRADHRRRLHADRLLEIHHRRVRRRHLLDRRRRSGVLLDLLRPVHPLPRGQDAAEGLRQASPWQ